MAICDWQKILLSTVTLRDLEITKEGIKETFSEYMIRWKGKASKMVNR